MGLFPFQGGLPRKYLKAPVTAPADNDARDQLDCKNDCEDIPQQ